MACARCGSGIYKTEEFISLNKVWHKYCFTCFQCGKKLDKDSAKIFQGELFCECCYTNVIEKLFEVISSPSVGKPNRVASTPSCAVTNDKNSLERRIKNCENLLKTLNTSRNTNQCCPAENKRNKCIQRTVQSCSCIPSQSTSKNEYCLIFPIPREVANYYNRIHMKNNKGHRNPFNCDRNPCPACSCRKSCVSPLKCPVQLRTLKDQCCCSSTPPCCKNTSQQGCCCSSSPKQQTCPVVFKKPCGCPQPQKNTCCDTCTKTQPCCHKQVESCQQKVPRCCCCSQSKTPSHKCANQYRPPPSYVLPPRCSPGQRGEPPQCCPQKLEGCCCTKSDQSSAENNCKKPQKCFCQNVPKYCVCGNLNPCGCKMSQIRAQCTVCCNRCGQKVYAAEKILVSSGSYHTSCFTCFCCNKYLDVKNVYEGCGEIYCKQCYSHFFGVDYYGFGGRNC